MVRMKDEVRVCQKMRLRNSLKGLEAATQPPVAPAVDFSRPGVTAMMVVLHC